MALADICNRLSNSVSSRKCPVPGGINRKSWVFQIDQFTGSYSKAASGAISGFTLVDADEKGIKATGRPKKGSGASKGNQADTGSTEVEQTLIQEFTFSGQEELDNLEAYLKADGKVVFQELASGQTRIYFKEFGNETATFEETTGTLLADESGVMKATIVGKEPKFPMFFEAPITGGVSQLEANRAYLDALTA
jgi:hypothetical protein